MKIAIIGGGMAGLGAAYELSNAEHSVTLYERSPELGGLASGHTVNGVFLEDFYHHLFPTYHDFLTVARELGIENKIFFKKVKTANFLGGRLYPFSGALDLIRFSPITLPDRIRTGFWTLFLKLKKRWNSFEHHTAREWLRSHFGASSYRVLWGRLLESKFAERADAIGMVWMWAKIFERPSRLGYLEGGFRTFVVALEQRLRTRGVRLRMNASVSSVDELFRDGYDAVIVAAPHATLVRLADTRLPQEYKDTLQKLGYVAVVCAVMVLKRYLTPFYWINVLDEQSPFVGVIEQTNLVDEQTYGGSHPVYLTRYVAADAPFYHLPDEEIKRVFLAQVKKIRPDFDERWIETFRIIRAPYAQHIAPVGYGGTRPPFRTPVKNLWWVSMAHTYPWDRGTNHSFRLGRDLARELLAEHATPLSTAPSPRA